MFLGEFQHSLDAKGRVILPAKYRDQLAEGALRHQGQGGCLSVFTPEEFETVASQMREQSKRGSEGAQRRPGLLRRRRARSSPTSRAGSRSRRNLRTFADLEREVMVVGLYSRIEIWDRGSLARARPAGRGSTDRIRRSARLRDLTRQLCIDNGEPSGPPPAPRAARRKRPFRPLRFRRRVRGAGGGPEETRGASGERGRTGWLTSFLHQPVMVAEVTDLLAAVPTGVVVDATVGGGGHSRALLTARPDLRLLGIDRDPVAVAAAGAALEPFGDRVRIVQGGFEHVAEIVGSADIVGNEGIVAILFDLGVSSPQLDRPVRGFSYWADAAPLDMRMDSAQTLTAADGRQRLLGSRPRGADRPQRRGALRPSHRRARSSPPVHSKRRATWWPRSSGASPPPPGAGAATRPVAPSRRSAWR